MEKKFISNNIEDTKKIAKEITEEILKLPKQKQAVVIGLSGELGSGKTTFVQSFAKSLGIKERVISPTYVIFKKFKIQSVFFRAKFKVLVHIDAYRIKDLKEMVDLGWEEMAKNPENIILVEWAENIKNILPQKNIWLIFSHKGENKRAIDFGCKYRR